MPDPVITAPETAPSAPAEHSRRQLEALLEVSEAIAQQRDLRALFTIWRRDCIPLWSSISLH